MRKGRKLMKVSIIVLIIVCLPIVSVLMRFFVTSKDRIEPFLDAQGNVLEGSVAQKVFLTVNGNENGMIIRGKSEENPVLLFISGGPGVPQYWLNEYYENKLEDYFTVCWWDYYGEGLSYDAKIDKSEITLERLEQDAVTITEYLKERFSKDKIYLMAHSGGTPLGVVKRAMRKMDALVTVEADGSVIPKNPDTIHAEWESVLLSAGCATTREMRSDALDIFFPQMQAECYTFTQKIDYWRGKALCTASPYHKFALNSGERIEFDIPVYFLNGYYDYTCPTPMVETFYQSILAPDKDIYIFQNSAHSPLWEENDAVLKVMCEKIEKMPDY